MDKKDVFISYKAEEFDDANWVKSVLEKNGISCWIAPTSIHGGFSYASVIPQAIRDCKVFVLILSEKAQLSKWVPRELDQAINENKVILPFMIENCPLKDDFNFYLSNVQRYIAYENKAKAMEKMVKEIKSILGIKDITLTTSEETKQELPKKPENKTIEKKASIKTKSKPNKKLLIGIISALVLVCAVVAIIVINPFSNSQISSQISSEQNSNSFTIAGEKYTKYDSIVTLREKTLTKEDVNSLKNFKDLGTASFYDCTFSTNDLSAVFTSAKGVVTLENCNITDEMLKAVDFSSVSITSLNLKNNKGITDLSVISDLSDTVTNLIIDNTGITDISVLKDFTELQYFSANCNGIADISSLSTCADLYDLSLNGNKITSLKSLENCGNLVYVDISNNQLKTLEGLEKSISLSELNVSNNQLTSLKGIENATVLTKVSLSDNLLEDISILEKSCATLKELYLHNNKIKDISALSNSTSIKYVSLDNNQLTSIDALAGNTGLNRVSAANNKINNMDCLSDKSKLIYIDLSNNAIETAGKFADGNLNGSQSVTLDLSNNKIKELKVPKGEYANFYIYGNEIKDFAFLDGITLNGLVFTYINDIDYSTVDFSDTVLYIIGCPLDKQLSLDDTVNASVVLFIEESEVTKATPFYKNVVF